jgi:hypothetical protein
MTGRMRWHQANKMKLRSMDLRDERENMDRDAAARCPLVDHTGKCTRISIAKSRAHNTLLRAGGVETIAFRAFPA